MEQIKLAQFTKTTTTRDKFRSENLTLAFGLDELKISLLLLCFSRKRYKFYSDLKDSDIVPPLGERLMIQDNSRQNSGPNEVLLVFPNCQSFCLSLELND